MFISSPLEELGLVKGFLVKPEMISSRPTRSRPCAARAATAGQDVHPQARWKTPLFGDQLGGSAAPRHARVIGSAPRSGRSASLQGARENNPARFQLLSDGSSSPLISPGCRFCRCKPVIVGGKRRTWDASGGEEMYFHSRQQQRQQPITHL